MANKYRNEKSNGYDSKREAARAAELRLLERAGKIRNLREQVRYELIPAIFEAPDGSLVENPEGENQIPAYKRNKLGLACLERSASYVADFVYEDETGATVVEDAKGYKTKDYLIKRKLLLWRYGIKIREV